MMGDTFELNQVIREWRSAQSAAGEALRKEDLDELETHLRDQVEALVTTGVIDGEEAFLLARRRLGDVVTLGCEYRKSGAATIWSRRFFWMLAGYLGISVAWTLAVSAGGAVTAGASAAGIATPLIASVSGTLVSLVIVAAVLWCIARGCWNGGSFLASCFRFARTNPVPTVIGIALIPVLVAAGNIATNIVVTSVVDVETFGQMALAGRYTALVAEFGIFALLGLTAVLSLRAGWGEERSLPGS